MDISFDGEGTIERAYFDEDKKRHYAEFSMVNGVNGLADTRTKLKLPITPEQFHEYELNPLLFTSVRLRGKLELIAE